MVSASPLGVATIATASKCIPDGRFSGVIGGETPVLEWSVDDVDGLDSIKFLLDRGCKTAATASIFDRTPLTVGAGLHFTTIQDAIDHATDGDIIQIEGGVWSEHLDLLDRKVVLEPLPGTGEGGLTGGGTSILRSELFATPVEMFVFGGEICDNLPQDVDDMTPVIYDGLASICSEDVCPGDITGDCVVTGADLGLLISYWTF